MRLPSNTTAVESSSQGDDARAPAGGDGDLLDFLVDPTGDARETDQDVDP